MFEKIGNSWKLAKECWRVLMLDKEMLMFPLLSTFTTIVVLSILAYPMWALGFFEQPEVIHIDVNQLLDASTIITWILLMVVPTYICYVILTFFNSGLITCAFIRLCGDDPVLTDGFHVAWKRLPNILTWSILAASVGLLLRLFKGRNNILRSLIGGTLELGWRVASFFAIPIIVAEEKGAIDALKRSGKLIKKNWGEALTLEVGLSVLAYPVIAPVFVVIGLCAYTLQTMPMFNTIIIALCLIYVFIVSLVFSTLDAIAKAALYMVATGDQMPENFNNELLETVFKRKSVETPAWA